MKAVVISRAGGPEVLDLRCVPDPEPAPDEVVVSVRASALNRADLLQRRGLYPAPPGSPPDVPGLEFAGEVAECGSRVRTPRVGDRVMGILGGGGQAELVAVRGRACMPIPHGLGWEEAAAVPEAFLTAYDALSQARLATGERVLVHAAASGIGTAAVQVARALGARVVALSRSSDKRRRLRELGVEAALDGRRADLGEAVRRAADEAGVDVVVDLLGAEAWALNLEVLAERGRVVIVGLLSGSRASLDLAPLVRKRLTVIGTVLRSRSLEEKAALSEEFSSRMGPLFESGRLRPVIDRVLPLEEVSRAHEIMERNENFGKIVLRVR